ncbi:MAG: ferrochelatase, partial [Candidatus Obscuribacterales bacterium]|nr:ferrochelatase [Candidatus Obscuribacterales bacterium]
ENVTRGRNVPKERLLEVAKHYEAFGGVSPINEQNRHIIAMLTEALEKEGPRLPIYWGNRNWYPFIKDALQQMRDDGIKKALAFVTSAYSSYSSCRQYLDDIDKASKELGESCPQIDKIRPFFNHPLFVEANAEHLNQVLNTLPQDQKDSLYVAFTAHSIPKSMADNCNYSAQLTEVCRLLAEKCKIKTWNLVYQSRSGPPQIPWLEPDILAHIRALHQLGVKEILIHPVGFVSDHMEVKYDLDHEAHDLCKELGIVMHRTPSASINPHFIEMIRDLIIERLEERGEKAAIGNIAALPDQCAVNCCPLGLARPPV